MLFGFQRLGELLIIFDYKLDSSVVNAMQVTPYKPSSFLYVLYSFDNRNQPCIIFLRTLFGECHAFTVYKRKQNREKYRVFSVMFP